MEKTLRSIYIAPEIKDYELTPEGVLCVSGDFLEGYVGLEGEKELF